MPTPSVNPFLTAIPFVAIVRAQRMVGGVPVESLRSDSVRVFFRVARRAQPTDAKDKEIMPLLAQRTIPAAAGFGTLI
jgi:hypothetical protein